MACTDVNQIAKVTLIRQAAVTHCINMDQRFQSLAFRRQSGKLRVTMHGSRNIVPPGPYMLFVVNTAGVPSVAKFIRVG